MFCFLGFPELRTEAAFWTFFFFGLKFSQKSTVHLEIRCAVCLNSGCACWPPTHFTLYTALKHLSKCFGMTLVRYEAAARVVGALQLPQSGALRSLKSGFQTEGYQSRRRRRNRAAARKFKFMNQWFLSGGSTVRIVKGTKRDGHRY